MAFLSGASPMKRSMFAIGLMIGAAVLAQYVLAQPPGQPGRGGPPNPLLQAFDTDHDGTLSAAEIDAAAAKLRERDANKDGKLTADELPRGPGGRGGFGPGRGPGPMEAEQRPGQAAPAQGRRREADPRRPRAGPRGRAVRQRLDGRRPAAPPAHRGDRRQAGRRAGHLDRRVGALVLAGPPQDRRQALHPRHRPRPDRRRPRELQEGRRRRPRRHHRGRRPRDGAAEQGADRRPVHRRREGRLRRLPQGTPPLRPPRRADHRPQHAAARAQSAVHQGHHHQPRPRHVVRAHGRRRGRDHAQEC